MSILKCINHYQIVFIGESKGKNVQFLNVIGNPVKPFKNLTLLYIVAPFKNLTEKGLVISLGNIDINSEDL